MGAKRKRGEPGRPSGRRGPDPAEVAEEYVDDDLKLDRAAAAEEAEEEAEEIPSGTFVDQQVYENLDENRAQPADPKRRSRQRSALSKRTVPARTTRPSRKGRGRSKR